MLMFFNITFSLFFSDRAHGKEFSRQFEDACNKLEDYVVSLQKEIDHRTAMITMLEQSELFYEDQYREAKIVANVSKKKKKKKRKKEGTITSVADKLNFSDYWKNFL